jgi:hypothetical protein
VNNVICTLKHDKSENWCESSNVKFANSAELANFNTGMLRNLVAILNSYIDFFFVGPF